MSRARSIGITKQVLKNRPLVVGGIVLHVLRKKWQAAITKALRKSKILAWTVALIVVLARESGIVRLIRILKEGKVFSIIIIVSGTLFLTGLIIQGYWSGTGSYEKLFPGITEKAEDIAVIRIERQGKVLVLRRQGEEWRIAKENKPASVTKIRRLIQDLGELKLIEAKTNDPEKLGKLGLEDPKNKKAYSCQLTLKKETGTVLDVIIGNSRKTYGLMGDKALYMRHMDDNQAWLVKGELNVNANPESWMDKAILNLPRERIAKVMIDYDNNDYVEIIRKDKHFTLKDIPEGKKLKVGRLEAVTSALMPLNHTDIKPASEISFPAGSSLTTTFVTTDGLGVVVKTVRIQGERWSKIRAGTESKEEKIRQEADAINKKHKAWAYKLPEEKAELITMKRKELIE